MKPSDLIEVLQNAIDDGNDNEFAIYLYVKNNKTGNKYINIKQAFYEIADECNHNPMHVTLYTEPAE